MTHPVGRPCARKKTLHDQSSAVGYFPCSCEHNRHVWPVGLLKMPSRQSIVTNVTCGVRRRRLSFYTMDCPACKVHDEVINVCIDPCVEVGADSGACLNFGCPIADTTTVRTISQWPVSAPVLETSDVLPTSSVVIAVVVVAIFVLTVVSALVWRWRRRRRQSSVNNRGIGFYVSCSLHFQKCSDIIFFSRSMGIRKDPAKFVPVCICISTLLWFLPREATRSAVLPWHVVCPSVCL